MLIASVLKGGENFRELLNKLLELKTEDPKRLKEFFFTFGVKNREAAKLVQVSYYAGEYLKLLLQRWVFNEKTPVVFRVFGRPLQKVTKISFSPKVDSIQRKTMETYEKREEPPRGQTDRFIFPRFQQQCVVQLLFKQSYRLPFFSDSSASPSMLKAKTTRNIATPGARTQGKKVRTVKLLASASILPHEG